VIKVTFGHVFLPPVSLGIVRIIEQGKRNADQRKSSLTGENLSPGLIGTLFSGTTRAEKGKQERLSQKSK
jgi:hypothetical protein